MEESFVPAQKNVNRDQYTFPRFFREGLAVKAISANHICILFVLKDPYKRNIMKNKFILVTLLFFAAVFYSSTSQAQAIVITNHEVVFIDADGKEFPSIQAKSIVSPNGNVTIIATFQLEKGNDLILQKGVNIIGVSLFRQGLAEPLIYVVNIPPSGRFTIKYHLNGAGHIFPQVWERFL